MSTETSSNEQQKPVDQKRAEQYATTLEASGMASDDRRVMEKILQLATKASAGEPQHMPALERGFSMLRRFRRLEAEAQAAFDGAFKDQHERMALDQHYRTR